MCSVYVYTLKRGLDSREGRWGGEGESGKGEEGKGENGCLEAVWFAWEGSTKKGRGGGRNGIELFYLVT